MNSIEINLVHRSTNQTTGCCLIDGSSMVSLDPRYVLNFSRNLYTIDGLFNDPLTDLRIIDGASSVHKKSVTQLDRLF